MRRKQKNSWFIILLILGVCTHTYAQDNKEETSKRKSKSTPNCQEKNWRVIGEEIGTTFRDLGIRIGTNVSIAAQRVGETLAEEQTWQDVGDQVANAGREVADATQDAISNYSSDRDTYAHRYDEEKTKKFSKTFKLGSNDRLAIENKFGKVHINTWDKQETSVDVVMIAKSSSESKAQTLLDRINIVVNENSSENEILVKTQFDNMNNWSGGKQSFEINYTVNMPRNNPLRIKNSFGDTYVADINGKSDLQCSYGSLKAEKLNNADNYVKVSFGDGRIGYCKSGEIKASYSNLEITEGNNLTIESSFSELEVRNIQAAKVKAKYGSIDMGTNGKGFKSFDIDGSFSDIDLRIPSSLGFDFDIKVSFADLDWNESGAHFTSVEKSGSSKNYVGSFGKSSGSNIRVSSRYGDVDFKIND